MSDVTVTVTEYTVTAWPVDLRDHPDAREFAILVRPTRVDGKWAVTNRGGICILTRGGSWSMRIPRGLRCAHYRPLDEALDAAALAAPLVRVGPWTLDECVSRARAWRAEATP